MMSILVASLLVCVAGALGGVANALITDNGFFLPQREQTSDKTTIVRPGFLGNILVGMVSALISWGLYSSFGAVEIFQSTSTNLPPNVSFTIAGLVGAMLVGVGGARWLSNEVDKRLLHTAAVEATTKPASQKSAQVMGTASPVQALAIAQQIPAASQEAA